MVSWRVIKRWNSHCWFFLDFYQCNSKQTKRNHRLDNLIVVNWFCVPLSFMFCVMCGTLVNIHQKETPSTTSTKVNDSPVHFLDISFGCMSLAFAIGAHHICHLEAEQSLHTVPWTQDCGFCTFGSKNIWRHSTVFMMWQRNKGYILTGESWKNFESGTVYF